MANYQYVIDSSFRPFSMQEMLAPLMIYKDAYEKQEAVLDELNKNTDTFKYLEQVAKDNPESEAAQIYNTYASDLRRYGDDFSQNGLSMNNRRGLLDMKRRYQGEIGLLDAASKAMEEVRNLRKTSKDPSMIYAEDNLNIDQFLYGRNPNLYGISGNDLYTRGAAAGKAASSRMYKAGETGSVLGGYYRNWKETRGVSQESIADFMNSTAVQQEVDNMLKAEGVTGNLTGANYERARQQILNGIYAGIVYEESNKPIRDEGKMSEAAREQYALQREQMAKSAAQSGLTWDDQTKSWVYDINKDPAYQRQNALAEKKAELEKVEGNSGTKKPTTTRDGLLEKPLRISFNSSMPERTEDGTWQDVDAGASFEEDYTSDIIEPEDVGSGKHYTYSQLPSFVKRKIPANLDHNKHLYIINEDNDTGGLGLLTPNSYTVTIVPVKTTISNATGDTPAASSAITDTNFGF